MVTDEEYRKLLNRVEGLEKKVESLAQRYSLSVIKNGFSASKPSASLSEKKKKDISRYRFNGSEYCKRKLVLVCVKYLIERENIRDYSKITELFPPYVQGALGVVRKIEEAERYTGASKRFFFGDDDVIHLRDCDCVICSQWEAQNIERFVNLAKDLGLDIAPVDRKYK